LRVRRTSLAIGIGRDLLLAILVCAVALLVSLSMQLIATKHELREHSLERAARYIERNLLAKPVGQVTIPNSRGSSWASFGYPTLVFHSDGRVLFQRPADIDPEVVRALFDQRLPQDRPPSRAAHFFTLGIGESRIIGVSLRVPIGAEERFIQVFKDEAAPDVLIDEVIDEFPYRSVRVLLPIFGMLLLSGAFVVWRRTRPIAEVSAIAATIGPDTLSLRLPESDLPREVLPIVQGVNGAFERLEQAAAAQREFLRRAAHHLRTPLTVLSARAATLDDSETANHLRNDVSEVARTISQLLQLSEIDGMRDGGKRLADLGAVGEAVREELASRAAIGGYRIRLIEPEAPVLVRGDPNVIEIAVRNLVENALQHAPAGSKVEIRVFADGGIEVRDAGAGVDDEVRNKIFEPFWSGDPHGARAGLGLVIVRRVAERYGATVTVGTEPEGGGVFTMRFPVGPTR
jgi:signal transduction histidine kinase